jgi:hypothetical protein
MVPQASSDYAEQVHFVQVKVEADDDAAFLSWPCVYFPNKEELRTASVDLLSSLGHGKHEKMLLELEMLKHKKNNRIRVAQLINEGSINSMEADCSVAYLLGKKTPGNERLVFEPTLEDFQSHFHEARSKLSGNQGFKDALTEAINLIVCDLADDTRLDSPTTHGLESEPEFSRCASRYYYSLFLLTFSTDN